MAGFAKLVVAPRVARGLGAVGAVVSAAVVSAAASCGPPDRPAELNDGTSLPDASAGDGPFFSGTPTGPPPCTLDASAGVCGCLDLTPFSDAPNIYMMLDRSGSMTDLNKWET